MPSGYTYPVQEGKVTTAKDFIKQSARAFGAYVMVRDEPMDKEVPEKFEPSTYNKEQLEKVQKRLVEINTMSDVEVYIAINDEHKKKIESNKKYYEEQLEVKKRYLNMISKVERWNSPSSDHTNLKDFCLKQLNESLRFDVGGIDRYLIEPVKPTINEWRDSEVASCKHDIEYHEKEWAAEVKRTNERNLWIKQLNDSLNELN